MGWNVASLQWNFAFSLGDFATLLLGLGTVYFANVTRKLQKRQNDFVDAQTKYIEKQTEIMEWHRGRADEEKRLKVFEFKRTALSSAYALCVAVRKMEEADKECVTFLNEYHLILKEYFKEETAITLRNVLLYYNLYAKAKVDTLITKDEMRQIIHTSQVKLAKISEDFYTFWDEVIY